jgi:hypothetical protein
VGAFVVASLAACQAQPPGPVAVDGWEYPGAAPLRDGERLVAIEVDAAPESIAPDAGFECPSDYLGRVRLVHDPEADTGASEAAVTYRTEPGDEAVEVVWQIGVSARVSGDRVIVVGPDGQVLATEGEPSLELGGAWLERPRRFQVCFLEYLPRPLPSADDDIGQAGLSVQEHRNPGLSRRSMLRSTSRW